MICEESWIGWILAFWNSINDFQLNLPIESVEAIRSYAEPLNKVSLLSDTRNSVHISVQSLSKSIVVAIFELERYHLSSKNLKFSLF